MAVQKVVRRVYSRSMRSLSRWNQTFIHRRSVQLLFVAVIIGMGLALLPLTRGTAGRGKIVSAPAKECSGADGVWFGASQAAGQPDFQNGIHTDVLSQQNSAYRASGQGELTCNHFVFESPNRKNVSVTLVLSNQTPSSSSPLLSTDSVSKESGSLEDRGEVRQANVSNDSLETAEFSLEISHDGMNWQSIYQPRATDLAGPYLSVSLPGNYVRNIENLQVRFVANAESSVLVDAVLVTYEEGTAQQLSTYALGEDGKPAEDNERGYGVGQKLAFEVKSRPSDSNVVSTLTNIVEDIASPDEAPDVDIDTAVLGPSGPVETDTEVQYKERDAGGHDVWVVTIDPGSNFPIGKYKAEFDLTDSEGNVQRVSQDFLWGVLAINTDKSMYRPNEDVNFAMAVLDDQGRMQCDAELTLEITGPRLSKTLSTKDKSIQVNQTECQTYDVTTKPDFEAHWKLKSSFRDQAGRYLLKLTAKTTNGERVMYDSFEVREDIPFEISRGGPTRIFPLKQYDMKTWVKANQDFEGAITDYIPREFQIYNPKITRLSDGKQIEATVEEYGIGTAKGSKWPVKLTAGDSYEISYTFDPPDISPEFWLVGPLRMTDMQDNEVFKELRLWQIASDALPVQLAATKKGSFTKRNGTGAQSVTNVGFRPKAVIFWMTRNTADGTTNTASGAALTLGMGFATSSTNERTFNVWEEGQTAAGTTDNGRSQFTDASISSSGLNGALAGGAIADFTSMDADGFTLNWGESDANAYIIHYYAISEHAVTDATVNEFEVTTATGNIDVGNAGFQPDFVLMASIGSTTIGTNLAENVWTVGAASSSTAEWTVAGRSDDAADLSDTCSGQRTNAVLYLIGTTNNCATTTQDALVDFTAFEADGFDVNVSNAPAANMDVYYLALRAAPGISWSVGSDTKPVAAGSDSVTGLGSRPGGVFHISRALATSATLDAHSYLSVGAASAPAVEGNSGFSMEDNVDASDPGSTTTQTAIVRTTETDAETLTALADTTQFGPDGFTLNYTTSDGTADQYLYWAVEEMPITFPKLTQEGYVFENDDEDQASGDVVDENTIQAGSSFTVPGDRTLASVKSGERITLRTHLKNTGTGALNSNLGLFYDRNDGMWSQVGQNPAQTAAGNCNDTNFDCATLDNTGTSRGQYNSLAVDSNGNPWVSYYDTTTTALMVARYVGSSGTGCTSAAWTCEQVDNTGTNKGQYTSMAFDAGGKAWISYYDVTTSALVVAQYVGSGGTGCTSAAWTCETVDNTGTNTGQWTSIAVNANGIPWVSFYDVTNSSLRVATRGGGFGAACTDTDWTCAAVANADDDGKYSSIAINPATGFPWVSYYQDGALDRLWVASYVQTGGSCTDTGWACETVDDTGTITGLWTSIAFDPNGIPWVSYYDQTNTSLRVATRGTTPWNPTGTCTDADWECDAVDNSDAVGEYSSIAFDPAGNPWVGYYQNFTTSCNNSPTTECSSWLARFVGASGSCTSTAWSCNSVDDQASTGNVGQWASIAFAPDGRAWLAQYDTTNTANKVVNFKRGGEIIISSGLGGANSNALNESHADMTSATDTTGQNDPDCISGSTTWNNGQWFENVEGANVSLPIGSTSAQCTEVSFTIDTSQAVAGQTYRFIVASKDGWRNDKGAWRGPISVASGAYPTLTVEAGSTSNIRFSKDSQPKFANCTDTTWGCMAIDDDANNQGTTTSSAVDSSGKVWISYYDTSATAIVVAEYVGSSGTGCGGSPAAWTCTTVDNSGTNLGTDGSIAISPSGVPYVSYWDADNTSLKVAWYVGTGGNCTSTAWSCTTVDNTGTSTGNYTSIAFSPNGTPYISYRDTTATSLKVAWYVGTSGNCTAVTWSCTTVDNTGTATGDYVSMAFSPSGIPYVSYQDVTNTSLKVAQYVGSGGSCTDTTWSCTTVDNTGTDTGTYSSIAFNSSGAAYVSFTDVTNTSLRVAWFVGSGGSCTSAAWSCTAVDNTGTSTGQFTSIAFNAAGMPYVSYHDVTGTALKIAWLVGSGGSCTDTTWSCVTVDNTGTSTGSNSSLVFDKSGAAWVSFYDTTNQSLRVAKQHLPATRLSSASLIANAGRSAGSGDARYRLDGGKSPASEASTCSAIANHEGYCGAAADDTDYDTMTAAANERPMFAFSMDNDNNTDMPVASWVGRSDVAPSTRAFVLQVYRFGTTNAWQNVSLDTDTCTAAAANTDCTLAGDIITSVAEYYENIGSDYRAYFRVYQTEHTAAMSARTDAFSVNFVPNLAPNSPSSLAQRKVDDTNLAVGAWTNETSVEFTADISDANNPDTLELCIEVDLIGVAFSNTEDSCNTPGSYTGTAFSAEHTIGSLADTSQYHWQARVRDDGGLYSAWVQFGGNTDPNDRDFGIDTTAPTGGTVYDGDTVGVDEDFTDTGLLTELEANWASFSATVSGLDRYQYAIGTTSCGTEVRTWTDNSTTTSVTATGLTLQTSQIYYFGVRAVDNAGNTQACVASDGQFVLPTLSFSVSPSSVTFANLNQSNSYTNTQNTTLTTSTNAYGGYRVSAFATGLLTAGSNTISMFSGGTYASPDGWVGGDTGFGFTTNDADIFTQAGPCPGGNTAPCYAPFSLSAPGNNVASSTASVTGDIVTLTYRTTVTSTQAAAGYTTSVIYIITATY